MSEKNRETDMTERTSEWLNNELMTTAMCIAVEVAADRTPAPNMVARFNAIQEQIAGRRQLTGPSLIARRDGESYGDYVARCLAGKA